MTESTPDRTSFDGTLLIDGKPTAVRWTYAGEDEIGSYVAYTPEGEPLKIPRFSRFSFLVDTAFIKRANDGRPFRVAFQRADDTAADAVFVRKL